MTKFTDKYKNISITITIPVGTWQTGKSSADNSASRRGLFEFQSSGTPFTNMDQF